VAGRGADRFLDRQRRAASAHVPKSAVRPTRAGPPLAGFVLPTGTSGQGNVADDQDPDKRVMAVGPEEGHFRSLPRPGPGVGMLDGAVNPPGKHFPPHRLPNRERAPLRVSRSRRGNLNACHARRRRQRGCVPAGWPRNPRGWPSHRGGARCAIDRHYERHVDAADKHAVDVKKSVARTSSGSGETRARRVLATRGRANGRVPRGKPALSAPTSTASPSAVKVL
jgi:hypothetical protein